MRTHEVDEFLNRYFACWEGRDFASGYSTLHAAWDACDRVDWLVWARFYSVPADRGSLRLFACWCVRETPLGDGRKVWNLLTDPRSRNAVEVAERFAVGKATREELAVAYRSARDFPLSVAADAAAEAATSSDSTYAAEALAAACSSAACGTGRYISAAAQTFQLTEFRRRFSNPFKPETP